MGEHARSWVALIALGAFHGINPAMGWLFAVALGLQEHRRAAVLRALLPLALGHALAIVAVIGNLATIAMPAMRRYPACGGGCAGHRPASTLPMIPFNT